MRLGLSVAVNQPRKVATSGPVAVAFGALTLAGAGGVDAPAGASAISGGTATGYTLSGGVVSPTSNGSATSGTMTFTGSAVTWTITAEANTYSVKPDNSLSEFGAALTAAGNSSGITIKVRPGTSSPSPSSPPTFLGKGAGRTDYLTITSHDNANRAKLETATFTGCPYLKFYQINGGRPRDDFSSVYHPDTDTTTYPGLAKLSWFFTQTGTYPTNNHIWIEDCVFTGDPTDGSNVMSMLGFGTGHSYSTVKNCTFSGFFNCCMMGGGTYLVAKGNTFTKWAGDALRGDGSSHVNFDFNKFSDPLSDGDTTTHQDSIQIGPGTTVDVTIIGNQFDGRGDIADTGQSVQNVYLDDAYKDGTSTYKDYVIAGNAGITQAITAITVYSGDNVQCWNNTEVFPNGESQVSVPLIKLDDASAAGYGTSNLQYSDLGLNVGNGISITGVRLVDNTAQANITLTAGDTTAYGNAFSNFAAGTIVGALTPVPGGPLKPSGARAPQYGAVTDYIDFIAQTYDFPWQDQGYTPSFTDVTGYALTTQKVHALQTVSGFSATGGLLRLNQIGIDAGFEFQVRDSGGTIVVSWGTAPVVLQNGDQFEVRVTSASSGTTTKTAKIFVGGKYATWSVTTASALVPAYITTAENTGNVATGSNYTFNNGGAGFSVGTADSKRLVIIGVLFGMSTGTYVPSVTVDGNAATLIGSVTGTTSSWSLFQISVPTGTSIGNVVLANASGNTATRAAISLWTCYPTSSTPVESNTASNTTTNAATLTGATALDCANGGVIFMFGGMAIATVGVTFTTTWSGTDGNPVANDARQVEGAVYAFSGMRTITETNTTRTLSMNASVSVTKQFVAVSFGA